MDDLTPEQREARRAANVDNLNGQLYELFDAGALTHFTHYVEPSRHDPQRTLDVWVLTFADGERRMSIHEVRSLLRGWRLGRRHPR